MNVKVKVQAILQARCSSTRLPGKVLKPLLGKPMLQHQIERIQRATRIDRIVVATSTDSSDDPLLALCQSLNIACVRGSLDDVLARFASALNLYPAEVVVRLTGDCPVIDPKVIDEVVSAHLSSNADYSANCIEPTLPDGMDVEVMDARCLAIAAAQAGKDSEREHVTPYIYNHPEQFHIQHVRHQPDYSGLRWTVDNPEDFQLISLFYQRLYPRNPTFGLTEMIELVSAEPELCEINQHIGRNEGYAKSLREDKE